ncbi:MAG: DUF1846 domain-containing protein [Clostridia bacterium]|nr:DUF1846 domain-containing protein [Clostridia bacterium]
MKKIGFDSEKYLSIQTDKIVERIKQFGGKLYLEFGGKLFDDFHASRVLPGFAPDNKIKMLCKLKHLAEIVIVINSDDIAKNKVRADLGITYDVDVLRLIDVFRMHGLYVGSIVLSRFNENNEPAKSFKRKLEKLGLKVYLHYTIKGYPTNIPAVISDEGFGKNEYVETTRDLVVITAPGPGSGKMATCLSQLYHDYKKGIKAGYAKYETFPVWSLPLTHPVNIAYEAATADLNDMNMIDPWHLQAYGETAVNYNRDVEVFPVLNTLFEKVMKVSPYKSPTDMGVNMAGFAISNDEVCQEASKQEIIRRYFKALENERRNNLDPFESEKILLLMNSLNVDKSDRAVYKKCVEAVKIKGVPCSAIQLDCGTIITGKTSNLFESQSAALLNALKYLAGIPDEENVLAPETIVPITKLKVNYLSSQTPRLHIDETLIALSSSSATNKHAEKVLKQLVNLKNAELHSSVLLPRIDVKMLRKLGINQTSSPVYEEKIPKYEIN